MRVDWKDEYNTGVDVIDRQHHMLVNMIDSIDAADGEHLALIIKELVEYASLHFDTEEMLMQQFDYPDVAAHCAQHAAFADHVRRLMAEWELAVRIDKANLFAFLESWLISHIQGTDQQMAAYLKSKRAG